LAYNDANLHMIGGAVPAQYIYASSDDTNAQIAAANYFPARGSKALRPDDIITVISRASGAPVISFLTINTATPVGVTTTEQAGGGGGGGAVSNVVGFTGGITAGQIGGALNAAGDLNLLTDAEKTAALGSAGAAATAQTAANAAQASANANTADVADIRATLGTADGDTTMPAMAAGNGAGIAAAPVTTQLAAVKALADAGVNSVVSNTGALTGAAPAGAEFGIDTTTGQTFFVSGGNWTASPAATVDLNTTVSDERGANGAGNTAPASQPTPTPDVGDLHIEVYDDVTIYFTAAATNWTAPARTEIARGAAVLPTTTKGDIIVRTATTDVRLPIGAAATMRVVDASTATGFRDVPRFIDTATVASRNGEGPLFAGQYVVVADDGNGSEQIYLMKADGATFAAINGGGNAKPLRLAPAAPTTFSSTATTIPAGVAKFSIRDVPFTGAAFGDSFGVGASVNLSDILDDLGNNAILDVTALVQAPGLLTIVLDNAGVAPVQLPAITWSLSKDGGVILGSAVPGSVDFVAGVAPDGGNDVPSAALKAALGIVPLEFSAAGFAAPGSENSLGLNTNDDTMQEVVNKLENYTGPARVFLDDTSVAPATAGEPTLAEIDAQKGTAVSTLLYYTGTDTATDVPTKTYWIDGAGVVTEQADDQIASQVPFSAPALMTSATDTQLALENARGVAFNVLDFMPVGTTAAQVTTGAVDAKPTFDECGKYIRTLDQKRKYTINFAPGLYTPTGGHSFNGISRVNFQGNGAEIQSPGFVVTSHRLFNTQNPYYITADFENNLRTIDQTADGGDDILQANAGDLTITMASAANSAQYLPDDVIFIQGYDNRRNVSTPPSLSFFEWVEVASVAGAVITLKTPLRHTYRPTWFDFATGAVPHGPARVIPWEFRRCAIQYEFGNFTIRPIGAAATANERGNLSVFSKFAYIHDVDAPYSHFNPQVSQKSVVERCRFLRVEIDKLVDNFSIQDSEVQSTDGGSNVTSVVARRTKWTDFFRVQGRSLDLQDCQMPTGTEIYNYDTGNTRVIGNEFAGPIARLYDLPVETAYAYTATNVAGRTTAITFTDTPIRGLVNAIGDVWMGPPAAGAGPVYLRITGFDSDGAGNDVFLVDSSGIVADNGFLHSVQPEKGMEYHGNRGFTRVPGRGYVQPLIAPRDGGLCETNYETSFFNNGTIGAQIRRVCLPVKLSVNVIRPYTGPDATCRLRFLIDHIDDTWTGTDFAASVNINLRQAGLREIYNGGPNTPLAGDNNFASLADYFSNPDRLMVSHRFFINSSIGNFQTTGNAGNSPDASVMPLVKVRFQYEGLTSAMFEDAVL